MSTFKEKVNEMLMIELGFDHPVFGGLRVIMKENEPWFVYSQVAKVLGLHKDIWRYGDGIGKNNKYYKNGTPTKLKLNYQLLDNGVVKVDLKDSNFHIQSTYIINEVNLYRMIFASKKPNALEFQSWVFGKVLPQIRKNGKYVEGEQENGCFSIQEFADHFCNRHPMKLGQNKVFALLKANGVITRNNLPIRKYIDNGCMTTSVKITAKGRRTYRSLITPKGVSVILQIIKDHYLDEPRQDYNPNQLRIDGTTDRDYYNR